MTDASQQQQQQRVWLLCCFMWPSVTCLLYRSQCSRSHGIILEQMSTMGMISQHHFQDVAGAQTFSIHFERDWRIPRKKKGMGQWFKLCQAFIRRTTWCLRESSRQVDFPGGSAVKNLPAMQDTQVRSLDGENSLEEGMATHPSTLA